MCKELLAMQTWFAKIITAPLPKMDSANLPIYPPRLIQEIRKQIASSPHLRSEERMGIYHQQYWWRLLTAMQELYPSLVRLFNHEDFNLQIAEPYLLARPPNDWSLSRIGWGLPEWLETHYLKKDAPLILALAHLDFAYENLVFAEKLPKIEPAALSQCKRTPLFLQPFVLLFELEADIFTFRTQLLEHPPSHWETQDLPPLKKSSKKLFFALSRNQDQTLYEEISPSYFALLSRLQKGTKLCDLLPFLAPCDPIVEWFQALAAKGWLTFSSDREKKPRVRKQIQGQKQTEN